jgi:hypothetical protein
MAVKQKQLLSGRADVGLFPRRVKITNFSENSFTVSWVTEKPVAAAVQYQLPGQASKLAFPLDQKSQQIHHITVSNLLPGREYAFYLLSGGEIFDNQGEPFVVTTCSLTEQVPGVPFLVYGQVKNRQGQPVSRAVVYFRAGEWSSDSEDLKQARKDGREGRHFEAGQSTPISTTTNEEGNFILTINNSWSLDKKDRFQPKTNMVSELWVEAGDDGRARQEFDIHPDLNLGEVVLNTGEVEMEIEGPTARPIKMSFWQKIKRIFQF